MTISRFRIAAAALIGFNVLGAVLTWTVHLQKPNIGDANAIAGGTQFTGPLMFVALGIVAFVLTYASSRRLVNTGVFLLGLWGAGFTVGEVSELLQHNVGISAGRWDVVLGGSVVGAIIGISTAITAGLVLRSRRQHPSGAVAAQSV